MTLQPRARSSQAEPACLAWTPFFASDGTLIQGLNTGLLSVAGSRNHLVTISG